VKPGETFDPGDPAAAGYQLVFDDEFNDASSIDLANSGDAGFNWYLRNSFRNKAMPANNISIADGILTIGGSGGNIQTFCRAPNPQRFVGKVFGGGAYFESRFAFDPYRVIRENGWPSFWGGSFRHSMSDNSDQWPGQVKGYTHYIEDDFFEYDSVQSDGIYSFASAMHDWYGVWNVTCKPFCGVSNLSNYRVKVPVTTDWKQFHVIGQLWVAGIPGDKKGGYIVNYFDGKPTTASVSWMDTGDGVPPPSGPSTYSILDKDRLVVFLSTGKDEPFRVDWVHVWQTPAAAREDSHPALAPSSGFTGGNGRCVAVQ
jgi:hypothetical protein